jgi:iron complex transport system permease protein
MITARRVFTVVSFLGLMLLCLMSGALLVGSTLVPLSAVVQVLLGNQTLGPEVTIILNLRLPRIVVAALAGGGLSVAGAAFQALTRNPLADPSLLGVSSGAAFGVVVAQVLGLGVTPLGMLGLTTFAFFGALLAAVVVFLIARTGGQLPIQTLLLAGVIVALFFSSAITLMISLVDFNRLGGVIHWLLGNLSALPSSSIALFALLLGVGVALILTQARRLNLLSMGEEPALQLGVEAERLKRRIFVSASLLTASVVTFTGPIGFVGLIVPHAVRLLFGGDNRLLIPASFFAGASFLLLADTFARSIVAPSELAVGVVTAFAGTPFFVYLLRTRYRGLQ